MDIKEKAQCTAKHARILKLILDAIMLILLVLMYKKQVISIGFHEIGGLALIGLFFIHHFVNARWIGSVTKRFFVKNTPGMVRARYIVDALLLIAFLTVGITGIMISKVVFNVHIAGNAQPLHYFSSAMAIILMGVHLGLHADYIFSKFLRKGASKAVKVVLAIIVSILVVFGGYSVATTSFVSFLSAPLMAVRFTEGSFHPSGEPALDGASGERPSDISQLPEFSAENDTQSLQDGTSDGGNGFHMRGNGQNRNGGGAHGKGGSTNAAMLVAQYVSIIALFGAATYGIVKLTGRRRKPLLQQDETVYRAAEQIDSSGAEYDTSKTRE